MCYVCSISESDLRREDLFMTKFQNHIVKLVRMNAQHQRYQRLTNRNESKRISDDDALIQLKNKLIARASGFCGWDRLAQGIIDSYKSLTAAV